MKKHKLRRLFEQHIKKEIGSDKDVALLLSSGLDGLVVGLAAQDVGNRIHAYTFQMGDNESFDSKHAKVVASKLGWKFNLIKVPYDVKTIAKTWPILCTKYMCRKKRDYECAYPMLYCYKAMTSKFEYVLSGLVADAYFVFNKNTHIAQISGPKSDQLKFDAWRQDYWRKWFKEGLDSLSSTEYNPSGMLQHILLCEEYNLKHVNPWLQKSVYNYFIGKSWQELNMPHQKMCVREAWKDYIDIVGHRPHRGYQTEANIPEYFEQLLSVPSIANIIKPRERMIDVAKDWHTLKQSGLMNRKLF